jgi:hypothetical protein
MTLGTSMTKTLSYADAVKLLGRDESKVAAALGKLTGGLLAAATGGGGELVLGLFDAKADLARLGGQLVTGLRDRLRGLGRFERTERLAAAHSVIVITAFFDAFAEADLPFDARELRLQGSEQVALATGTTPGDEKQFVAMMRSLLNAPTIISPQPHISYEETLALLRGYYTWLGDGAVAFLRGLAIWDRLNETQRARTSRALHTVIPDRAVRRYEELFRQLAVECPEVAFWTDRLDHQATRTEIRRLGDGLAGLELLLTEVAAERGVDDRRDALSRRYRAELDRPIIVTGDAPSGLTVPSLGSAYVNAGFRAAEVSPGDQLDTEEWWRTRAVHDDLQGFMLGRLTAPDATRRPLIVLGQPGSGKSVLTKVLAARLPPSDYLVARVALREAPADADLQDQIEYAIRDATGERLSWPDLVRTAAGALPVVLLDGFDELLQATGVSQSDYLEKVVRFQERESDQGRPVAVIVTSRIAVADRAHVPHGGAVALRLEPFTDDQIRHWLGVWNEANAHEFTAQRKRPLTAEVALRYGELAAQPLLLLMLALYDADDNGLQDSKARLDLAALYERLLTRFAEREIRKNRADLDDAGLRAAVHDELLHLSVMAFAMFNRGRQWVTEPELDADLTALLDLADAPKGPSGFRAPLSAAQVAVGRFFFVHQAQAIRDDVRLATCEFLHATFVNSSWPGSSSAN